MNKAAKKPVRLEVTLSEDEHAAIKSAAKKDNLKVATWVRFIALREARVGTQSALQIVTNMAADRMAHGRREAAGELGLAAKAIADLQARVGAK